MRFIVSILALAFAPAALAVPLSMGHQGHIDDSTGTPLEGNHSLTVTLYDAASGGTDLWSDTFTTNLDNGFYSLTLGSGVALSADTLAADEVYVALSVDGGPELPRLSLTSVPFAIHAGSADTATHAASADKATSADTATSAVTATNLSGGTVDASSISVNGSPIVGSDGSLAVAPAAHTHAASDINTGTLAVARLPVGTGADQIAAGKHTHTLDDLDISAHTNNASAHHAAYTNSQAVSAVEGTTDLSLSGNLEVDGTLSASTIQLADGRSMPRVERFQKVAGTVSCSADLPSFTFTAAKDEEATIWFNWSGRPDAEGHTYANVYLDGDLVISASEWDRTTWRRTMDGMVNVTFKSTGTHTIKAKADCGNGTGAFYDNNGEWPLGGLSYTVLIGG